MASLVAYLANLVKGSAQDELDGFFAAIEGATTPFRAVTKGALTQARAKLASSAFVELTAAALEKFYERSALRRFAGFRLLAVDGTRLRLPHWPKIRRHFGSIDGRRGKPRPMAQASFVVDVLNEVVVAASIEPICHGEKSLAVSQVASFAQGDLVLLDRGYDAHWFLAYLRSTRAHFCARARCGTRKLVADFVRSGRQQLITTLAPSAETRRICGNESLGRDSLDVRLVRVELCTGEIEVLITSLVDTKAFPAEIFQDLYAKRWGIEERFKALKSRALIERFTGKSVHSVNQDFHAKIFATNLVQILASLAQHHVDREHDSTPPNLKPLYRPKINLAQALSKSKNLVVPLLLHLRTHIIGALLRVFVNTTEPIRPGRHFPRRVSRVKLQGHHLAYAPAR